MNCASAFAAVLLTLATVPITITEIAPNVDMSGMYLLNVANELGLRFGTDLMFTYGPLGFLYMTHNIGNNVIFAIVFYALLALAEMWLLYHTFCRLKGKHGAFILCASFALVFCSANNSRMTWSADYYICFVFFLAIGLAWVEKTPHRYLAFSSLLTVVAMLIKFNTGIQCAVTLALYALMRLYKDRDREALKCLAYPLSILIGYAAVFLCYNPSLSALLNYVFTNLEISSGYSSAMSIVPTAMQLAAAAFCIGCYCTVLLYSALSNKADALFMAIFGGAMFQCFKHGYVRADMHIYFFFDVFLTVTAVILLFWDYKAPNDGKHKGSWGAVGFLVLAMLAVPLYVLDPSVDTVVDAVPEKIHEVIYDVPSRIQMKIIPSPGSRLPDEVLERIDGSSVAILPWELSIGAYNDIDMRVMPALQSLMAYTPSLDEENAEFFRADTAPEYIVMALYTIDGRVPLIETPATWMAIYENYYVVWEDSTYVLLKKMDVPYDLSLADGMERVVDRGERVYLPDTEEQLFVRVETGLTTWGKLVKFLYQIPPVNIKLTYSDGSEYVGRVIPELLENGVILDNLPESLNAVCLECNGWKDHKPIISFQLDGDGWEYYRDTMTVITQPVINKKNAFHYSPYINIQVEETEDPTMGKTFLPEQGLFWLDKVNETAPGEVNVTTNMEGVFFSGWALDDVSRGAPDAVFLKFNERYYRLFQNDRADVCQAYYGNNSEPLCGYEGWLPLNGFAPGRYSPSLIVVCENGTSYYEGYLPTVEVLD